MTDWFVYILQCSDNTYYTGITTNTLRRLKEHNSGKGSKYTGPRQPSFYLGTKRVSNRSEATKLELCVKKAKKKDKLIVLLKGV